MASGGLFLGSVSLVGEASNLNVNINASNGDALLDTMGALNVQVQNASLAVTEASLDACIASNQVAVNVAQSVAVPIQGLVGSTYTPITATSSGGYTYLNVFQSGLGQASAMWQNGVLTDASGGGLGVLHPLGAIQVGALGFKQISIYGHVVALADGSPPLNLTIVYSQDGSNWVTTSLGNITLTAPGNDFSRDWTTAATYVSVYGDTAANVQLWYSVSM